MILNPSDPAVLSGVAVLITAVVGYFTYRTNRQTSGANTAIDGLDRLTERHEREISRLGKALAKCETDKEQFGRTISRLEGQLDVLKVAATGPSGEIGITGRRGPAGDSGKSGPQGKKGEPGKDKT